ncbi:hypothetical protein WDW89_02425 [Deltaproteobacteria bacterium TL4]
METEVRQESVLEITGIIIPNDWGAQNAVTSIVMCTPGEKEYLIEQNSQGQELLEYIRRMKRAKVKLKGNLKKDKYGKNLVQVSKYKVLEW